MDWRHRAICRDEDPELFFPVGNSGPALLQIAEAKTVCRRCPVVSDCLAWALESGQDAGVWGGMSEDERRRAFHPFQRGAGTHDIPGVGLGLSVVRRIVSRHGGSVDLDSAPGAGTTVQVRLPASG